MNSVSGRVKPRAPRSGIVFRSMVAVLLIATVTWALLATSCSSTATSSSPAQTGDQPRTAVKGYANPDLLVETDWLAQNLADPNIRLVDTRPANDYKAGHIKGAISIPVDLTYGEAGNAGTAGSAAQITEMFGAKGIGNDSRVIVYDAGKQYNASRMLWTLEYYGHRKVAVLNGGFKKWQKENREVSTVEPIPTAAKLTVKVEPSRLAAKADVLAAIGKQGVAFVDARSSQEYKGDDARAKRGGHIPGAVNVDWVNLFTAEDTFKSAEDLASIYQAQGVTKDKEVYANCQVGMRSAVTYFTLRLLGYDKVRHYVASWQEWGNDPSTPIEK